MSDYLLYNGRFYKNDAALIGAENRGLRYGDGLFETLKVNNGLIELESFHFERLFAGLALLEFDLPSVFTHTQLAAVVHSLCKKNQQKIARVRINVFRGDGGIYDPQNHFPHWIIQSWPLPSGDFDLNDNGLVTGIFRPARKAIDGFSHLKSNNFLPYTMAALYAKKQRWNDAILLNSAGSISDSTIANVFTVKNGQIFTNPLSEGCVAGVMRRFLLEQLPVHGFMVEEKSITEQDLLAADEVFLSNAIKGIRWVAECEGIYYSNKLTTSIFAKLLKNR